MNTSSPTNQASHFQFNCELFHGKLYMMLRGLRVDLKRVEEARERAEKGIFELQARINGVVGNCGHLERVLQQFDEQGFAQLVLACLGGRNPRIKQAVLLERWQPLKWNGKRWVKDGKLVSREEASNRQLRGAWLGIGPPPLLFTAVVVESWLKPVHKTVERLQPFTPSKLADCEPHVLESKRAEWKQVKKLWKELNDERSTTRCHGGDKNLPETPGASDRGHPTAGQRDCALAVSGSGPLGEGVAAKLGELSLLLNLALNTASNSEGGDTQRFLYEICALPKIWKDERTGRYSREAESEWKERVSKGVKHERRGKAANRSFGGLANRSNVASETSSTTAETDANRAGFASRSTSKRPSTDQQALDKLYALTQDERVLWVLQQRRLRKLVSDLETQLDPDGRMRFSLSFVKETGRMATSVSPSGTGTNLQAWNKDLRHVFVADEGCELGQFDLEGADSWTVAAECAALGDTRMLEDLRAGMKPARGLCFAYETPLEYECRSAADILARLKERKLPDWLYPAAKAVTHASSYGAGWQTVLDTVLKYSMADLPLDLRDARPIVLAKLQVEKLQASFFTRYPGIKHWHEAAAQNLITRGFITTSAGHMRRFYGRKAEWKQGRKRACHDTLKEALASGPQFYTTLVIKRVLHRLWYDSRNRLEDGSLLVEPLLCVHDSLLLQWRVERRTQALAKVKEWFDVEVEIAGQKIRIPYEGCVARDWGMKIGEKLMSISLP